MPRSFIPRDKPRSWVIFMCSILLGLVVLGPLLFLTAGIRVIYDLVVAGFGLCAIVAIFAWFVFFVGLLGGKYRNLPERPWKEQVW